MFAFYSKRKKYLVGLVLLLLFLFPGRFVLPKTPLVGSYFTSFYQFVDGLSFFPGSKVSPKLYYPEGAADFPKAPVGQHFFEKKQAFVLLTTPTEVYTSPQTTEGQGVRVATLPLGARVSVSHVLPSGWAFVLDSETKTPIGWCQDANLGYKDRFTQIAAWELPYVGICIGEYCAEFNISQTGRFKMRWESIGQGLHLAGEGSGVLYQYKTLVWFKQDNPNDLDELLVLTPEGELAHEFRRKKEVLRLSKEKDASLQNKKKSVFSL